MAFEYEIFSQLPKNDQNVRGYQKTLIYVEGKISNIETNYKTI